MNAFQLILRLRQICDHGVDLLPANLRDWVELSSQYGFQAAPLDLDPEVCGFCGCIPQAVDEAWLESLSCAHHVCRDCLLEPKENLDGVPVPECPVCQKMRPNGLIEESSPVSDDPQDYRPSSKVRALLQNIEKDIKTATAAGLPQEKRFAHRTSKSNRALTNSAEASFSPSGRACSI